MPVLPQYTAPGDSGYQLAHYSGGAHATADDMGAGPAAALGDIAQGAQAQIKQFQNEAQDDDARTVMVKMQALKANYSNQLRDAALNGTPLEPIGAKMQEDLAAIQTGTTTRRGYQTAEQHGYAAQEEFQAASAHISAQRYGAKLKEDIAGFDNSAAIRLQAQPGLLPQILQDREDLLSTFAGRIPPELASAARTEGKERLTVSAVNSTIEQDPHAALFILQNQTGVFPDLTPEKRAELVNVAQAGIKAENYDSDRARREAQQEQKVKDDGAMDGMLQDFANGAGIEWEAKRILGLTAPSPEQKLRMLSTFEHLTAPQPKGLPPGYDPVAANAAYQNIFRPAGDPLRIQSQSQIDDLIVAGKIDIQEHENLSNAFRNREKPAAQLEASLFARVAQVVNPRDAMGNFIRPDGAGNEYRARSQITNVEAQWIKNGNDIADLMNPDGKPWKQNIQPILNNFKVTGFGAMTVDRNGNAVPTTAAPASTAPVVTVKSAADIDKLQPGAKFRGPSDAPGVFRVKPGKPGPQAAPSSVGHGAASALPDPTTNPY